MPAVRLVGGETQGAAGAGGSAHQATFHRVSAVLAKQGGPTSLEVSKCDAHLQAGPEGGPWELQACQPDLGAGEGYEADHVECHHAAHTGQLGDQARSAGVYEWQVLPG